MGTGSASVGPDDVVTTTCTITGTDFPLLCSDSGCEGIYPGPSTCDEITVEYERTNSKSACVAVLDTLECRYTSGVVVSIR